MATFDVYGPFEVPVLKLKSDVSAIDETRLKDFWSDCGYGGFKGCYVFAVRASKGFRPIYVGRASQSKFASEVFNDRNIKNCNLVLTETKKGTLVTFLVRIRLSRGRINLAQVAEVEEFLIGHAARKNKDLINSRRLPTTSWRITGVVNSGMGKTTSASRKLKKALGI